jgi:hypothetical protein
MDLQGVELKALKGMGNFLKKIQYIYIEVNYGQVYEECSQVQDIDKYLSTFNFIRLDTLFHESGWGDAFYIKQNSPPPPSLISQKSLKMCMNIEGGLGNQMFNLFTLLAEKLTNNTEIFLKKELYIDGKRKNYVVNTNFLSCFLTFFNENESIPKNVITWNQQERKNIRDYILEKNNEENSNDNNENYVSKEKNGVSDKNNEENSNDNDENYVNNKNGVSKENNNEYGVSNENYVNNKNGVSKENNNENEENCSYLLKGTFQDYMLFHHKRNEIFKFMDLEKIQNKLLIECNYNFKNTVSIHFRLGDYINFPEYHNILPIEYYENALEQLIMDTNIKEWNILVFYEKSDEEKIIENVKYLSEIFSFFNFNFIIPNKYEDYEELILMSLCKHNIIANSTFSWWGAYFNQNNPNVYYPHQWFGPELSYINSELLFLPEWCKISF